MPLFQQSVLKKYIADLDKEKLLAAWQNTDTFSRCPYSAKYTAGKRRTIKQKLKFSLSEQNEWLPYFENEKQKATHIQQLIQQTDKEIDAMVYALYGLTEDEIGIVAKS